MSANVFPDSGGAPLAVLTHALSAEILRAHAAGPLDRAELGRVAGSTPESTLRAVMRSLCDIGVLEARGPLDRRYASTALTVAGADLLAIGGALERWLGEAPPGALARDGDDAARAIVKALLAAWDSGVIRALAERPHSLVELSAQTSQGSESTLRRRLGGLRAAGLVDRVGARKGASYVATDWLHRVVVPLILVGRWSLRYSPEPAPLTRSDAEAALLLALPLIELSPRASGTCTLAVLTPDCRPSRAEVAGLLARLERGRVTSLEPREQADPPTWVIGTAGGWLDAVVDGSATSLRAGGAEPRLARHVVHATHNAFRCAVKADPRPQKCGGMI